MGYIDKFAVEDGYKGEDGCEYEDALSFIQTGLFGFCGCGNPEENLAFIRSGLHHIDRLRQEVWKFAITIDAWNAAGKELFGNDQCEMFFYYWADTEDLIEHGGSIPGWLSPKGEALLADLKAIELEPQD